MILVYNYVYTEALKKCFDIGVKIKETSDARLHKFNDAERSEPNNSRAIKYLFTTCHSVITATGLMNHIKTGVRMTSSHCVNLTPIHWFQP